MPIEMDENCLSKFLALLYKGLLLRKRHYMTTACEIVLPVLIACIPVIIQSKTDISREVSRGKASWVNDTRHCPFDPFRAGLEMSQQAVLFPFAPSNENTQLLMHSAIKLWKNHNEGLSAGNVALKDGDELESYCMVKQRENESVVIIATVFNNILSSESLPSSLDYTIRHSNSYMPGFATNLKYRFSDARKIYSSSTYFLSWQAAVEKAFIQRKMVDENKVFDYELQMQEFPSPKYKQIPRGFSFAVLIPVMISYGLMFFIANLMQRVIEEKSNGCKELLKMMGMTDAIYWMSTFTNYFIVGAIIILSVTIAYKFPLENSTVLLEHSDFMLLLILFLLFLMSLILFCLALTTFVNKSIYGAIIFIIFYSVFFSLLSSIVFVKDKIEISYIPLSVLTKFVICLVPPGAILTICEMILAYEASGEGIRWSNLFSYDVIPDFHIFWVIFGMLYSCFLYAVVIWYVDAVWPWQYGIPKPLYFPLTKSYWFGYKEKSAGDNHLLNPDDETKSTEFFEDDPTGISPGIIIRNLSKVFKTGLRTKVAVSNISLNIYKSQITALLGHNGAGKTTTLNILTGLYSPSNGTALISGWDVFSQTIKARQSLGVCPQKNVLYDTLTVEEHLKIYATLKGVKCKQLDHETQDTLKMLNLLDKKSDIVKNLSGGMKRKLCLGIAVIGGSKVLFLDEPTSGMDVEARRGVWDALLELRHNRTIVLTTHYMEEADILGDRIAIMADGEIQCCGSPLFLKQKFGTGYHLRVVKNENFDMEAVKELVNSSVPSASLENDCDGETMFNLMSNDQSAFGSLFEELELKKDTLGINSCGLSVTTMEDVFLNIATLRNLKTPSSAGNQTAQEIYSFENEDETEMADIYTESNEFRSSPQIGCQFYGLFMKRFHCAKRYWSVFFLQFFGPFIILSFCLYSLKASSRQDLMSDPLLKMDIQAIYGKTDSFYESDSSFLSKSVTEEFKKVLEEKSVNVESINDPEEFVINYGLKSLADYFKRLMIGSSAIESDRKLNLTAWFNGFPYHAEPLSLLLMDTAILRSVTKSGHITLTNDPLPHGDTYYLEDPYYSKERILANLFVPLALSLLSASFVLVPIHEKTSKAKLLQMMTGISSALYWLSMFAWDFAINTVVSILLIIPFALFSHYAFFSPHSEAIGTAILLMFLHGWSSIPFSYVFSLFFKKPNNGFSAVNSISIITGVAVCSIFMAISRIPDLKEDRTTIIFSYLLKLFPSYALSSGFSNLFAISYSNAYCETINPKDLKYSCVKDEYFNPILKCCKDICGNACLVQTYPLTMKDDACGQDILFLFLDGILYFLLLLLLESSALKLLIHCISQRLSILRKISDNRSAERSFIEDSDVLEEEQRVGNNCEQNSQTDDAPVVLNLTKQYKRTIAVNCLTFGIHHKECFGLLGVNGAGKTTTFRMLTGDCLPTSGNAFYHNYSIRSDLKKFQSFIGYCPQFDALIDRLSARETITLFARLRGLSGDSMIRYVNALIKMTDLIPHADKPSMVYSGGNKRKLSVALALVGAPPLLLLDEPTSGVDPVSRRKIWKILSLARNHSGAAVILTTHSMEESEALCSRLAIMVNGRFRCLGSIQHLKSKFGEGYTLIIKLKREEQNYSQYSNSCKSFIDSNLPGAHLKDDHQGMLQYHVVDPSISLSYLFKFMDGMQNEYNLEDYLISDTSLEQIFLTFARSQRVAAE